MYAPIKCKVRNCNEMPITGLTVCAEHKCSVADCGAARGFGSSVMCVKHRCVVAGCDNVSNPKFISCDRHKCKSESCGNPSVAPAMIWCINHVCGMNMCAENAYSCMKHKCRSSHYRCYMRVDPSVHILCTAHRCSVAGCTETRNMSYDTCYKHASCVGCRLDERKPLTGHEWIILCADHAQCPMCILGNVIPDTPFASSSICAAHNRQSFYAYMIVLRHIKIITSRDTRRLIWSVLNRG